MNDEGNAMSKLRLNISMSLDGYVAGPDQSVKEPLGVGGERLHEWVVPLAVFKKMHNGQGGKVNENTAIFEEAFANIGAHVMGRNMFGGHPGGWDSQNPWRGWWGDNPPFHHPVFVLTHHARAPLAMQGGTTFHFVTDGIASALRQAKQAAKGKDVMLGGGAQAAQQYLAAGLVDEMEIHLVPILLASGERLFERVGTNPHGLKLVRTVATPEVVHLKFAR
jgi:dihydrofolate reductase